MRHTVTMGQNYQHILGAKWVNKYHHKKYNSSSLDRNKYVIISFALIALLIFCLKHNAEADHCTVVVVIWNHIYTYLTHWPLGDLKEVIFEQIEADFRDWWLGYLLWSCPQINVTGPYMRLVNIGSGGGLVPTDNKPLQDLWRHMASLGHNELNRWFTYSISHNNVNQDSVFYVWQNKALANGIRYCICNIVFH